MLVIHILIVIHYLEPKQSPPVLSASRIGGQSIAGKQPAVHGRVIVYPTAEVRGPEVHCLVINEYRLPLVDALLRARSLH